MQNLNIISERIKNEIKKRNISIKDFLASCNLGINTLSEFSKGKNISLVSFVRIAEQLNVSVDFLLGVSTELSDSMLTKQESDLLETFRTLNEIEKARILLLANKLANEVDDIKNISYKVAANSGKNYSSGDQEETEPIGI